NNNLSGKMPFEKADENLTAKITLYGSRLTLDCIHTDGRILQLIMDFSYKRIYASYYANGTWSDKEICKWT
ncbi:hypothetical protein, partial [Diplocloster hominis]|uniref:hypothetical protein n=1 Tax=Diplocloster hominis TaxID=3079010 RepID=UPI0031BADB94